MKNKLPLILVAVGLVVVVGALVMRGRSAGTPGSEDENVPDLPFSQRPFASLTPTEDGHYLNLIVERINVPGAASMDYELYYDTSEEITQGVPGKVTLDGKTSIERELLLGSESSGKFRYDQGVDDGTLTLRFRDSAGKLIGKVAGQWHLQSATDELTSLDGKFMYKLADSSDAFFVTMPTFGLPADANFEVAEGPYGVFSSATDELPGNVTLSGTVNYWSGSDWSTISGSSDNIGVFVSSN